MSATRVATAPALELEDLEVEYRVRGEWRRVLRGISLQIAEGESYGIVGESGCGKSTAAYAALRYLPRNGRVSNGSIRVAGEDLLAMSDADVRRLRADRVSMVYQNPTSALNPTIRIGDQVAEVFTLRGVGDDEAKDRAREMLEKVQISDPARVMERYPHQLSGGMNQRVVIAMALAKDPTLLILDEPTTGLDARSEASVLEALARVAVGRTTVVITHRMAAAMTADRIVVLEHGVVVEQGDHESLVAGDGVGTVTASAPRSRPRHRPAGAGTSRRRRRPRPRGSRGHPARRRPRARARRGGRRSSRRPSGG